MKHVKDCLFSPFKIGKWFVLGFTAWMAEYFGSSGINYMGGGNTHNEQQKTSLLLPEHFFRDPLAAFSQIKHASVQASTQPLHWGYEFLATWGILIGILLAVFLAIMVVILWLGSRGRFMFLDNILHNRAEVQEPWRQYRKEGNSLFYATIVVTAGWLVLLLPAIIWVAINFPRNMDHFAAWLLSIIVGIFVMFLVMLAWSFAWFLYMDFGVPIMYCTRCGSLEAAGRVWLLVVEHPLDVVVYAVIRLVMGFVFLLIRVLVGLIACCIGLLPYLNTVLTLPLPVFRQCYILDCLAQLDSRYDLWKMVIPPEPPPLPPVPLA